MEARPRKKSRTKVTAEQGVVLMKSFAHDRFPSTAAREELSRALEITPRSVQVWFQNQRQKTRNEAKGLRKEGRCKGCSAECSRKLYVLAYAAVKKIQERGKSALQSMSRE